MELTRLIEVLKPLDVTGPDIARIDIGSIHYRAQDVKPNGLFVAVRGLAADGHDFIDEALGRGASAVVTQVPVDKPAAVVQVENTRRALAAASARFYGSPSRFMTVIGITGTNGKTTTALLIERILESAGASVGVIGTLNYRFSKKVFNNPMTTPESLDLQRIMADMRDGGVTHVVMEVSSHAVELHRVDGCEFDVGVFTNLTQDHLDFHRTMEAYWNCKRRFFTEILRSGSKAGRAAVVNHDDDKGRELLEELGRTSGIPMILAVGDASQNPVRPLDVDYDLNGMGGRISLPGGTLEFKSPLVGRHNLENILCAAGAGVAMRLSPAVVKAGLESVLCVPGRLERIGNDNGRHVYVDYAHTPDALENVLSALGKLSGGRIICVFGCGGDRDRAKRPQMGEIAGRLCELSVITSDNPRSEPPMEIIGQILEGSRKTAGFEYDREALTRGLDRRGYTVEPDRSAAIRCAILASRPGDTVVIAGKGNETYQIIGKKTFAFDDREAAREALSILARRPGAPAESAAEKKVIFE